MRVGIEEGRGGGTLRPVPAGSQEGGVAGEVRDLLAKLNGLLPPPASGGPTPEARTARMARVLDIPAAPRRRDAAWPRWMVFCAEVGFILSAFAAGVAGPPYVRCRQMRDQGLFYYGTTVGSCVRHEIGARYEGLEAYLDRAVRRF